MRANDPNHSLISSLILRENEPVCCIVGFRALVSYYMPLFYLNYRISENLYIFEIVNRGKYARDRKHLFLLAKSCMIYIERLSFWHRGDSARLIHARLFLLILTIHVASSVALVNFEHK